MNNFCIETIKALDGEIYHIDYHQRRYEKTLNCYYKIDYKIHQLKDFLTPPIDGLYRCRVLYSNKEIVDVSYYKYKKRKFNKIKILIDNNINYKYKLANREELNKLYEMREDADDILIVQDGYIKDTSIANIALKKDETWYTPKHPLLAGVTRQRLIELGKLVEREIPIAKIQDYSQIALLNAMIDFDIITTENIKDIIC
ncbi:MAG: branched-chain amino acid aminotransferase [Epsilonproteobacteria bacterium]|nr:branched-chain amino acid aminotransferase [Campylobacterota bacterium]